MRPSLPAAHKNVHLSAKTESEDADCEVGSQGSKNRGASGRLGHLLVEEGSTRRWGSMPRVRAA